MFKKIIAILVGLLFVIVSLYWLNKNIQLVKNGESVNGIVVGIGQKWDDDGSESKLYYYPIVKFTDRFEQEHTVEVSNQLSNPSFYDVGDDIAIVYPKGDVNGAYINSVWWIYVFPSIFLGLGLLVLIGSLYMSPLD